MFCYASCFLFPLTPSGFFNGMLGVFDPGALNCYTFFRPIPLTLSVSRNLILTHLPFSGSLDSLLLRSDRTHSRSGILSRDATHASGGVIIFVRQSLSFSELSTSSLSSLDPYSDYVGSTSLLTSPPRSHFLMFMFPLFAPPQRMAEPTSFLPSSFPSPEISSFYGTSNVITPLGLKRYFRPPWGGSI